MSVVVSGACVVVPVGARSIVAVVVLIVGLLQMVVGRRAGTAASLLVCLVYCRWGWVGFDAVVAGGRRAVARERLEMGGHRNRRRGRRHEALVRKCLTWDLFRRSV